MRRPIVGFGVDAAGDWLAWLSCGHPQHVRHTPPFMEREWVLSESGRASRLGTMLNCVRCDEAELPAHFVAYKRTAEFSDTTVPAALRHRHTTKPGVWAKIIVHAGRLRYCTDATGAAVELSPGVDGIVVPEVEHHIEPVGPVRFVVEFYRAPVAPAAASPAGTNDPD